MTAVPAPSFDRSDRRGIAIRTRGADTVTLRLRRIAVETIVDTLALALIALVGSWIDLPQPFPMGSGSAPVIRLGPDPLSTVLLMGAILAAGDRIVRPAMEALTGRWLLATMGLFSVFISALTLGLAGIIAQGLGVRLASPALLWIVVIAAAYSGLTAAMRTVVGLDRVALDRGDRGRGLWQLMDRLPTPRRNVLIENLRLRQVYDTISSTLLDVALDGTRLGAIRSTMRRRLLGLASPSADCPPPRRVRMMLEDLGPTYVKIGQMLATRADILPVEWTTELAGLNRSATPFSWDEASAVIRADLGRDPADLFRSIENDPFAAASTAQVHRATLHSGELVVVKVQRPHITVTTKADLGVLDQLAKVAERRFAFARKVGARAIVAEFAESVLRELDFRHEAYAARRLAEAMARYPTVRVPEIHVDLSGPHVLTEAYIAGGIPLSRPEELRAAGLDPAELGRAFVQAMVRQILVDGFFHGDPHDGNVLAESGTGRLVFLDPGQTGELRRDQRFELIGLIHALKAVDMDGIADSLLALSTPTAAFDPVRFRSDLERLVRNALVYGDADSLGGALTGVLSSMVDNGLHLDGGLTMAIKAVVQVEATARRLAPDVDLGQLAIDEATVALRESLTPEALARRAELTTAHVGKQLVRRLPTLESAALGWLDAIGRGKITVELDTSALDRSIRRAEQTGRQVTLGVVMVGQLIGTAIVLATLLQPELGEFQLLGFGALAAFGLSLGVSFLVLRRALRDPDAEPGSR